MTTPAVGPELAVVNIIGPVTIAAATSEAFHGAQWLPVAVIACGVDMRAAQRETGLQVVIELPCVPVHRVVAAGAIAGETAVVRVLIRVAIRARRGGIPKHLRVVAGIAIRLGMFAKQLKPRKGMVKPTVDPVVSDMAALTILIGVEFS